MDNSFTYLPYKDTGYFSRLVTDYIDGKPEIQQFLGFAPTKQGLEDAISKRREFPVDRTTLVQVLEKQYSGLVTSTQSQSNIRSLLSDNTFTICTAHQPNLLTGYLYFIYKIIHAIKLAEELSVLRPDNHFVPVYYMGSEDNDLDELGTFRFRGEKFVWDGNGQSGAVGRMDTASLKPVLNDLFKLIGPPGTNCDTLHDTIVGAYQEHETVGAATQFLVNELFGRFGLVIIDPDDALLKKAFIPVIEDELLNRRSYPIINEQIEKLGAHYKIQANPRPLNLFYLADQLRERIEVSADKWIVVNTDIEWNKDQLLSELHDHPERFSPNVMLRGLFQETILPNVAFIGGGAEVAYWLQLKTLFGHYGVFYPSILLRQSVLWISPKLASLRNQLAISIEDMFMPEDELVKEYISRHSGTEWQTNQEMIALEHIFAGISQKATNLDATLTSAVDAALTKMRYQLQVVEKKMLRAEKRKMEVHVRRIEKLRSSLFPGNSLQERTENFAEYFLEYGPDFFDVLKEGIQPLRSEFMVVETN